MGIPLIGVAGSAVDSIALAPLHASLGGFLSDIARSGVYLANERRPNVIAPVDAIISAYLRGEEQLTDLEPALNLHGITLAGRTLDADYYKSWKYWTEYIKEKWVRLSAPDILSLAARGFFGDLSDPTQANAIRYADLAKYAHFNVDDWKAYIDSMNYTLDNNEIRDLYNRQYFSRDQTVRRLQRGGMVSADERNAFRYKSRFLPPPQDIAIMARRFAFAPQDVIDNLGLDNEITDEYLYWAERQGFGTVDGYTKGEKDGKSADFAKNYWRIHWQPPSPQEAYQWFFRFRPGRDTTDEDADTKDLVFPIGDDEGHTLGLRLALREAGFTQPMRKFFVGAAKRLFGFRQIGQIQLAGLAGNQQNDQGFEWVTQQLQAQGYARKMAERFAKTIIKQNLQRKGQQQLGITRQLIQDSWETGVINRLQAVSFLLIIGLTQDEADAAVNSWDLQRGNKLAKKLIQGIRKNYLLGDLTDQQAAGQLGQVGITGERISQYLSLWNVEQRQYRLERTPAILTRWLIAGLITLDNFGERLSRIGWAGEDIARILAEAVSKQQKASKGKPPKNLTSAEIKDMLKKNILSREQAIQRLMASGYTGDDAALLLLDWGL